MPPRGGEALDYSLVELFNHRRGKLTSEHNPCDRRITFPDIRYICVPTLLCALCRVREYNRESSLIVSLLVDVFSMSLQMAFVANFLSSANDTGARRMNRLGVIHEKATRLDHLNVAGSCLPPPTHRSYSRLRFGNRRSEAKASVMRPGSEG